MSNRRLLFPTALVAALMAFVSCGDDDNGGNTDDAETALARRLASATTIALGDLMTATAADLSAGAPTRLAPLHEFGLECPDVIVSPLNPVVITFDYEDGCTSEIDGRVHSGQVVTSITLGQPAAYSVEFTSYTAQGYTVDGGVSGQLSGGVLAAVFESLSLSKTDLSIDVDGTATIRCQNNSTPLVLTDDRVFAAFDLTIGVDDENEKSALSPLAVSPAHLETYTVETLAEQEVRFSMGCRWPTAGRIRITRDAVVAPQFEVDFGDGACDDQATLIVPGEDPVAITLRD